MAYQIPLFDLNFNQEEIQAVCQTLESNWISMGENTAMFETLFAEKLNAKHAVALTNCTVALHLALLLLNIQPGDEVIVPSLTFVATANAIRYVGARPVFCDIVGSGDLTVDPLRLRALITDKTKAIIVMHYAGFPCNMDAICAAAKEKGIPIIEDACHGPLSEYGRQKLGTIGEIGCFSFYSNKNISTGEGGMLVTNNEEIARQARLLRSHGMTSLSFERAHGHSTSYDVVALGYNYRIDDMRSALGLVQLHKLEGDLRLRAQKRRLYENHLSTLPGVIVPFLGNQNFVSNYIMPIVLENADAEKRDFVRNALAEKGIQTSVHYPAVHRFQIYKDYPAECPWTDYVTDCEITLPMYSRLSDESIAYICDSIGTVLCKK